MLRVLLIGKGGREHALAYKLSRSPLLEKLYLWPLGPALQVYGEALKVPETASFGEVIAEAKRQGIQLVVSGPEAPLAQGLANEFLAQGIPTFGPVREAALLESSKAFAKDVMAKAGIPTAAYAVVKGRAECEKKAFEMLSQKGGVVLKASGLAAGKGVFVCTKKEDVLNGLKFLYETDMSQASEEVVLEEILFGRECSYFTFLGGDKKPIGLGFAVDHKRLQDGDEGPNTGGMGCYAPVPWLPKDAEAEVVAKVVEPLTRELSKRGIPYTGFLYVGLMWSPEKGAQVVEFNVRLGDPEAQVLSVYDDRDWLAVMAHQSGIKVDEASLALATSSITHKDRAVVVVMASAGYPYGKDDVYPDVIPERFFRGDKARAFAASVTQGAQGFHPGSGRVLTVAARASTFRLARKEAYSLIADIAKVWPKAQWRTDIGQSVEVHDFSDSSFPELILASQSPRRESLLKNAGFTFRIVKPEVAEVLKDGEDAAAYVTRNAREKGRWVLHELTKQEGEKRPKIVISADTIVVLDGKILEKPVDQAHARAMLASLSGREHQVLTGVSILASSNKCIDFVIKTGVEFKTLSPNEIAAYIRSGEPMDKAGAYGAQGIGAYLVKAIKGSYTNVVGLPIAEVVSCLKEEFKYDLWE